MALATSIDCDPCRPLPHTVCHHTVNSSSIYYVCVCVCVFVCLLDVTLANFAMFETHTKQNIVQVGSDKNQIRGKIHKTNKMLLRFSDGSGDMNKSIGN